MKIELQEPFKSLWLKGYLRVDKTDGRKRLDLVNNYKERTTISYARYLFSVHLGYIVPDHLHVDHINDDQTDDRLENYQLLTPNENTAKKARFVDVTCPQCSKITTMRFGDYNWKVKSRTNIFCSSSCNAKFQVALNGMPKGCYSKLDDESIKEVKRQRELGLTAKEISNLTGVSLARVIRYWK